jgi:hypothetical protein
MYICRDTMSEDLICDPHCDFCWFCQHNEYGGPAFCKKGEDKWFEDHRCCNEFKCRIHEEKPESLLLNDS